MQQQVISFTQRSLIICAAALSVWLLRGEWAGATTTGAVPGQWTQTAGPTDGLVTSLAARGTILYAGTEGNGVFRSPNNGVSWVGVNVGLINRFIFSLAVQRDTIFAGTNSGGLFRSTDNAESWSPVSLASASGTVTALTASETTVFAGVFGEGVFRSLNNGLSWNAANINLTNFRVLSLATNGETIFVGTEGGGLFRSTNNGASWVIANLGLTSASVTALAANGNTIFAGTDGGGAFRSLDNGVNWMPAGVLSSNRVAAFAVSGETVFAGLRSGGVFRSVNNGASWVSFNVGLINSDVRALTRIDSLLFAGTFGSDGVFVYDFVFPGCAFSVAPPNRTVSGDAGGGSVTVNAGAGCIWTARSNAPWLTVISGASGGGTGTVNYEFAANPGPPRVGTLSLAGQTFTLTQQQGCTFTLSGTGRNFAAGGGAAGVNVNGSVGCTWTATRDVSWINITAGASGNGVGTVNFTVEANLGPARTGRLTIAGLPYTVTQESGCTFAVTPTAQTVAANGGAGAVNVATASGCTWTATSNTPWLTITAGANGNGAGIVNFTAPANAGPLRSGTLMVAGQTVAVTQESGCVFTINPTAQSFAANGGAGAVNVTTAGGCAWTAMSNAAWLTINSGASGNGAGTVNFTATANVGPLRTGLLTIAGQTFTVTQADGCAFTINPTTQNFTANGGNGGVNVTTAAGCAWTALSNVAWLTITAGASGNGAGAVSYAVAANTGQPRTGTLTVAGQTFTVTQDDGCSFELAPVNRSFTASGGTDAVSVATAADCAWTATSNAAWLTINGGASGVGNGAVNYSVAANHGPARTGTLTVARRTFTVTQEAGCAFTINPTAQSFAANGGAGVVNVTTASGCAWTATSNVAWLTINAGGAGEGNGAVSYAVAANSGPARTGTLAIAGQTFTVTQESGCAFTINPTAQSFAAGGGAGTVSVATGDGCAWTATSNAEWLTITAGASGNGSGAVNYGVAVNQGTTPRTSMLTVAGRTFTVSQSGVNPAPTLIGISPNQAFAGGAEFTLTVSGANFVNGSVVYWNGGERATTFGGDTRLTARIPAADLAAAGTARVTVFTPAPGGGASNAVEFVIAALPNPVPTLTSLNPNQAPAGGASLTLTINGTGFVAAAQVRWNGGERATSFVGATQLRAEIPAADLAVIGTAIVSVFNPAASGGGGGLSNALTFTITPPTPSLTGLSPNQIGAGGGAFTLTVTGANFLSNATVRWNGGDRVTTFVSATQLRAAITAADAAAAGTVQVTVFNPGGGESNALAFTIMAGHTISGVVTYGIISKSVPGTLLTAASLASGATATTALSGADGRYTLAGLANGGYLVRPSKSDSVNGITAFDAARVAQHSRNINPLLGAQLSAADVNGNGVAAADDALLIAEAVVGLTNAGRTGGWTFAPERLVYEFLTGSQANQHFTAILYGEVTGNWQPTAGPTITAVAGGRDAQGKPALLISGADFQPGLALLVGFPASGELRLNGLSIEAVTAASFTARWGPTGGPWVLRVINPDGRESPPFLMWAR